MKRHFTIIELLLVLGISAIMLTIAVPSFYRTMRGSAPGLATREIMGKINAARAYATANRTDVAIVFPQEEANVPKALQYRSYRVCEVIVSGSTITFKRWIPGENWCYLPKGVVVGKDKSNAQEYLKKPKSSDEKKEDDEATDKTANQKIGSVKSVAPLAFDETLDNCIVIRMDGMLHNLQPVLIKIRQGLVENGTVTLTKPHEADYLPLVVRFNGKVKAFREVVTE